MTKKIRFTEVKKLAENILPYELPKNWHWTTLENVAKWGAGGTPSRKIPEYYRGTISWIKTGELNDGYIFQSEEHITAEAVKNSSAKIFPKNSVVIAMYGATIGKVGILGIESSMNQACACAVCEKNIYFKFLFHYLISQKENFVGKAKGGAQPNISQEIIKKFLIPLPPIGEQKKIVERIESLFSKLDAVKSIVQKILDGYELRRSAILHKAFTGELTKNFRAENNLSLDDWQEKTLGEVSDVRDGTHDSPEFYDSGFPLITSKNLKNGLITGDGIKYICQADYEKINLRSKVDVGDILFAMIGTIGNPVVISEEPNFAIKNVALFKDLKKIDMKFLKFFLESYCTTKKMKLDAKGTTQKFLPLNYLRNFPVVSPSLAEQKEIVRVLDSLLDKEQRTKEIAEKILQEIDLLKKSVLARAFRGEL